jgi:hypothetical protein
MQRLAKSRLSTIRRRNLILASPTSRCFGARVGRSVGAYAMNGATAMAMLEQKYGKGNVHLIHLAEDEDLPRIPFLSQDDFAVE